MRFVFLLLILFSQVFCNPQEIKTEGPKKDLGAVLLHHVADKNEWSILPAVKPIPIKNIPIGPLTIPLSQHVVMLIICSIILIIILTFAFRNSEIIPNKLGVAIEPIALFIRDALVYPSMGKELGEKWLPFFYTLFFFLLTSNFMGQIPIFSTTTGNINVTVALASLIFIGVIGQGMLKNGFFGFFKNMIPHGIPWPIGILLLMIEIPSLFIRNFVLAIRLFANMIAGHFVILSLLLLIFVIHPLVSIVSVPLALFISLLEVLVAIIQAIVFTMLSAIFIGMASNHH